MEGQFTLAQTVIVKVKEVIKETSNSVGSFPCVANFINEVVHLAGNSLTANTKRCTLLWSLETDGAWLEWIVLVMRLLGKIKGVMHSMRTNSGC